MEDAENRDAWFAARLEREAAKTEELRRQAEQLHERAAAAAALCDSIKQARSPE